jgi:osmotically-inducible protein OsmY
MKHIINTNYFKKKILQNSIFLSLLPLFSLSGCMVGAFTAATSTTMTLASNKTIGEVVDDVAISSKIEASFIKDGFRDLYTKIKTSVSQGRVMYTGKVGSEDDMIKAVDIAWRQNGVKEVINYLKVDENSGKFDASQYAKDCFITARVKTGMLGKKNVKFSNYTVITSDNVVYIFGIARSEEELQEVSSSASVVAGVEKVINSAIVVPPRQINSGINSEAIDLNEGDVSKGEKLKSVDADIVNNSSIRETESDIVEEIIDEVNAW